MTRDDRTLEVEATSTAPAISEERRHALLEEALTHRDYLMNYIWRGFRHFTVEDREDVVQEVYLILATKIEQFRGDAQLRTWMTRVAWNAARAYSQKHYKRQGLRKEMPDDVEAPVDVPNASATEAPMIQEEMHSLVWDCLHELDPEELDVVILADIQHKRNQEIAETLELSVPAVKSRLHRARVHLRDILEHHRMDLAS